MSQRFCYLAGRKGKNQRYFLRFVSFFVNLHHLLGSSNPLICRRYLCQRYPAFLLYE